ncbi:SDR family oxidoreductase [Pseudoxanthomonas sp. X-1]|uniref:SDR family NAD(P)-dependent oxidoreductase n=1 Tax=Pseudoxanthomonas sp. X-1 TaxID=2571115 RepID=UPI00110B4D04|nr:SDR family oxidoreductase [Pseudoxanthomonas sp. X-1]TMN16641.1 SDR family oxidoreductase [Pseudoxanthomonas sp. X-1]UAY73344.1 SDR family oxidoreductase [Pseudoxanthomonas sp. X-1]
MSSTATPAQVPGHALITGASAGIGAEFARQYAARGVPLILTARRAERLQALAAELGALVDVQVIAADLEDPAAPAAIAEEVARRGLRVRVLVNNAGYGVPGRYLTRDWDVHARFIQLMVTALCELTWRLLPQIAASGSGRIINVASFAALVPGADGQTLYAPAKAWLVAMSQSLSLEYADHGVRVCALCPGFTWSEFHDVTGTREQMSRLPGWIWLSAEEVVREGIEGVERGQVLVIPGWRWRLLYHVVRHLPQSWLLALMARSSRKVRAQV